MWLQGEQRPGGVEGVGRQRLEERLERAVPEGLEATVQEAHSELPSWQIFSNRREGAG